MVTTPEVAGLLAPPDTLTGEAEAREDSEEAEPRDWNDLCGFGGALFATAAACGAAGRRERKNIAS